MMKKRNKSSLHIHLSLDMIGLERIDTYVIGCTFVLSESTVSYNARRIYIRLETLSIRATLEEPPNCVVRGVHQNAACSISVDCRQISCRPVSSLRVGIDSESMLCICLPFSRHKSPFHVYIPPQASKAQVHNSNCKEFHAELLFD